MHRDHKELLPFKTFFPTVLILATTGYLATNIYLPSLPSIRESFGTSVTLAQFSLTVYLLAFSLSQLLYGPFSDKMGRRKVAIFGLLFSLVGSFLCIVSWDIGLFLTGRVFQGLALGSGATLSRAIVRDAYSGDRLARIGSYVPIGTASLMASIPLLGGYLENAFDWRIAFVFVALYTTVSLLMVFFWLPETHTHPDEAALRPTFFLKSYGHLLASPIFLGYACCASLSFGGLLAYFSATTILFQEILGVSPITYGWLALLVGAVIVLGGFMNTFLLKRIGRHRSLVAGVFVMLIGGLLMLMPALFGHLTVWGMVLPMWVFTFGSAITFANAFTGALFPFAHIAGFVGALYGCVQVLGGALATGIVAMIPETNQFPLALILITIGVLSYLLQLIAFKASIKHRHHH